MDVPALSLLAVATGLLAVIAVIWMYFFFNRQFKQLDDTVRYQKEHIDTLQLEINDLENQNGEMQTRSMVQGKHMRELADQCTQLENQLREVKSQDPSMRLYTRAAELVKAGADVEEVMQACDLPRAEAELLISMHRQRS